MDGDEVEKVLNEGARERERVSYRLRRQDTLRSACSSRAVEIGALGNGKFII